MSIAVEHQNGKSSSVAITWNFYLSFGLGLSIINPKLAVFNSKTYSNLYVLNWFLTLLLKAMTSLSTALTATLTGAFTIWLGHEK